jgi:phosphatidylglycerol:prolipoprotein diacylglycerol transferase
MPPRRADRIRLVAPFTHDYFASRVHKIALQLGPLPVHWYGVLVALGFLAGLWTASRRGVRDGLAPESIMDAGVWLILGTLIGARALYVLTYWRESFAQQPWTEIFMLQHGGLVFYGGLIGATAATVIYLRQKKLPVWKFTDAMAPSVPLGYVFGRFGCLMNGCCYGRPTDLPWAIRFPNDHETKGQPVHPTQIYDSLLSLGLYGALAWFYRRKKFDGQIFAAYLVCYAVQRSFVETFRGDYSAAHLHGPLTPAQMVSVATFAAGLILYWKLPRPAPAPAAAEAT